MIRQLLLSLLFAVGAARAEGPDCSRTYTLALHDHGLLFSSDTGTGIDKDFTDELSRRSGCAIRVSLLPRARIWQMIEAGTLDFSLSGIGNAERERFAAFAWYFRNKYYLLVRNDVHVRRVDDFARDARLRLGVIRSFRYNPAANQLLDTLTTAGRVTQATSLAPLYQALAADRIQGMIIEPFDYPALDSKAIRAITAIVEFDDPPVPHGLIMSNKAVPAEEQRKWRSLVDAMRADGTVRRIFARYFDPGLAAAMTDY